jgi:recombinational DNA repair protein (RecF pathway)
MSNDIYSSEAFIIKTIDRGEKNQIVFAYTEKFGLIYAHIQSNRAIGSKLRQKLNLYALVSLNLVQGKQIWRITGIEEIISPFQFTKDRRFLILKSSSLFLLRFTGEEKNKILWREIKELMNLLQKKWNSQYNEYWEEIIIIHKIRVLNALGYWKEKILPYSKENGEKIKKEKEAFQEKISSSIESSQM